MGRLGSFRLRAPLPALLGALAATLVLTAAARAQIVINEIYPDPAGTDDPLERVEIYNAGSTPIDVTGWCIHDAATIDGNPSPARCFLPEDFDPVCGTSAIIQPGEFRLVHGRPPLTAWLNNTGGDVVYLCSNRTIPATIVHQVTYPTTVGHTDETWACIPDGSSNFAWHAKTLCGPNGGVTGDVTPPATVNDLTATPGTYPGEVRLIWTAPGDDGMTGTAAGYEMKISTAPINSGNFAAATDIDRYITEPLPKAGASAETLYVFGLDPATAWYFALRAVDEVPNTSGVSNSPGTYPFAGSRLNPDPGFPIYFGNLHSHTSYSDGVQTPPDAWAYARYTAQTPLDFLAVTDHNHADLGMTPTLYHQGLSQAVTADDDGNFVAIYGQEWGLAANGHVNLFESPALFGWNSGNYDVFVAEGNYPALYTAALANPPASYPAVALWCHPAASDFNTLQVTADGQSLVHLMCLVNGPAFSTSTTESDIGNTNYDGVFNEALRKGYRVSPTGDQDNHNATWGAATQSRTAVLATAKTKSAILAALAARRTYATQDHNTVVHFSAEGREMGRAFAIAQGVRIAAEVTDPDLGAAVSKIELLRGFTGISSAVVVASNTGSSTFNWRELQTFAPGTEVHYYLRILMADSKTIWTGPVYVTYDPSAVSGVDHPEPHIALSLFASPNPARDQLTVEFTLPRAGHASLGVFDLTGRRVRSILDQSLESGPQRVTWDGRSDDGTPASTGMYFLRLATREGTLARRVAYLH